jgi:hypothetical protein
VNSLHPAQILVFFSYQALRLYFNAMDRDKNGRLDRKEWLQHKELIDDIQTGDDAKIDFLVFEKVDPGKGEEFSHSRSHEPEIRIIANSQRHSSGTFLRTNI